ncbi:LOW QUALITY PROTEIN: reverse transcriptase [Phytophthora megakarya]|uniref:Reverse transcriptase n=1 Tax=Phytophthora megakarya TaxID=4795 RepID=A0A225V4K2_9STRA|nr:LOW QUALITY PROTEIN: reverse transcriptase [Phytophthora megakarya]
MGNAKPIALQTRKVPIRFREKVTGLIKGLLAAEIIRPSTSPWASPIVIVRKSKGVDVRLCIDYKLVNSLTRLMVYPMPLISYLLEDLDKTLWYCSLDMTIGFWVVPMTDRAREISAFITPFGLFEWSRVPFGLNNAPQIYQRLVENALYGILKISQAGDAGATTDVFQTGIADDPARESVLGRRSYIDDIMIAAGSWDQKCQRVEDLLEASDKWNMSISVAKRFWGMDKVRYLGHRVSIGGLKANPKDLKSLTDLPFPGSLRSMQSFLGSLNYYSRFIEDYAIYASVFYEFREVEFAEREKRSDLREIMDLNDLIPRDHSSPELKLTGPVDERWIRAHRAFITLKTRRPQSSAISTRRERRTRRDLPPGGIRQSHLEDELVELQCDREGGVGVAEDLGSLLQFASRTRDPGPNEAFHVGLAVQVDGIAGSPRTMVHPPGLVDARDHEVHDEILGAIAASITPRAKIDDALTEIAPRKEPKRRIQAPIPTVDRDEELWVISFDGSARVKRGGGAFSAIVWSRPGWEVVKARSGYLESLTVNEAEYNSLILGLNMLESLDLCGDSNLVIRQVRGEIESKAPGLTLLKRKALHRLRKWSDHELVHVKRDWNGSADSLASAALQRQGGIEVQEMPGYQDLVTLNRLDEILIPKTENPVVRVAAVTTRAGQARSPAGVMKEDLIREIRVDRIKQAQEEEVWIAGMKKYLSGSIADLTQAEARSYGKLAADYEVDEQDPLFYCPPTPRSGDDRDRLMRLVVPKTLQSDVSHLEDIMEWGEPTSGSGITSTGGDYTGLFSDMWESVWIVKQENENR